MASLRDTLASLFAKESPSAIQGTPLGKAYPGLAQPEQPLEAPFLSPDDLIGTGIGKAALAGGAKLAPLLLGQTAYHGSPHLFEKFSLAKAGSNSGQDYGFGTYFSSNPNVAKAYVKDQGQIYKVDIPDEHIPTMINWRSYQQTPEVNDIFKKHGLSTQGSGEDLYFEAIKKAGSSDEHKSGFQKAAEYLDSIGIKGVKYPNRAIEAEDYVVFNPSNIKILERNKQLSEVLKNK
jgi:hypothetical protein